MKNKQVVLYTNEESNAQFELTKEYLFETYSEERGWGTVNDVPHSLIYEEIGEQNSINWYDFLTELKKALKDGYYLLTGKVGRWNGTFDGGKFITTVNELLSSISHLDYITITDENGHLKIEGSHHDGSDSYELKKLTNKGIEYAERHGFARDRSLHKTIMENNLFSKLPRLAKQINGV